VPGSPAAQRTRRRTTELQAPAGSSNGSSAPLLTPQLAANLLFSGPQQGHALDGYDSLASESDDEPDDATAAAAAVEAELHLTAALTDQVDLRGGATLFNHWRRNHVRDPVALGRRIVALHVEHGVTPSAMRARLVAEDADIGRLTQMQVQSSVRSRGLMRFFQDPGPRVAYLFRKLRMSLGLGDHHTPTMEELFYVTSNGYGFCVILCCAHPHCTVMPSSPTLAVASKPF